MGKTRDLFKKVRDTKGTFQAKMGLIKHSKVMLKILQARFQQYMNQELMNFQAGFRKGRGTRDQLPTSTGSYKKQKNSRKTSTSALLT